MKIIAAAPSGAAPSGALLENAPEMIITAPASDNLVVDSSSKVIFQTSAPLQIGNHQFIIPQDAVLASFPADVQDIASATHLRIHRLAVVRP